VTITEWISEPVNWFFVLIGLLVLVSSIKVVTARNVVHSALFLVAALAGTAGLFIILAAEFVAWVLVLVYIGAVIVLFLFGIMITRAPTGTDEGLDTNRKVIPALLSLALFVVMSWASIDAFDSRQILSPGDGPSVEQIGESLLGRFVMPFEVVSFVLLAALIGGITIARRDATPLEEEQGTGI
jgi:NADH-quinone oxidoreductase subunit J